MNSYLLPVAVLGAAVAFTHLFCVRPMLRHQKLAAHQAADLDARIARARTELAHLRATNRPHHPDVTDQT